jgi:hypothetical protein
MSLLNLLIVERQPCPNCGEPIDHSLWFKLGSRSEEYRVGDYIRWGLGDDVGEAGLAQVEDLAISHTECVHCGSRDNADWVITYEHGRITSARRATQDESRRLLDHYLVIRRE